MGRQTTETTKVSQKREKITQVREIPVIADYDVVVCGGGPSGFIAAIAAARGGARVALIERHGFLGGMATASLVAPISVFNYNDRRIIDGIPWEFIERLIDVRSEEHTSELQSRENLVCRLL